MAERNTESHKGGSPKSFKKYQRRPVTPAGAPRPPADDTNTTPLGGDGIVELRPWQEGDMAPGREGDFMGRDPDDPTQREFLMPANVVSAQYVPAD